MRNHAWMWILWPSFLVAGAASATVFALVDPLDIAFFGHLTATRQQVYAGGFFFFWLMAALSSALTIHMAPRRPLLDEFGEPIQD
jgi:hypothetical protein